MNFDLSEEQQIIKDLATQVFDDLGTPERVKAINSDDGFDAVLWAALAEAGLLGLCLPEAAGGSGMGMVELGLIAEQQGRRVAPVPFVPVVVAAMTVAEHLGDETALLGDVVAGTARVTVALAESGRNDPFNPSVIATSENDGSGGIRVVGEKPAVPGLPHASHVLVPARLGDAVVVALVASDAQGVEIDPLSVTNFESQGHLRVDTVVSAERIIEAADALDTMIWRSLAAMSAVQLGVAEQAVAYAAEHVSERHQFGRPLSTFQAVSQRAADGYITTEALRSTVLNATWQLDHGTHPQADVLAAAYWASDGTQDVILAAQHLHGGLGADTDHPVHRQFLWGMQNASTLGNASSHLSRLGKLIAAAPAT